MGRKEVAKVKDIWARFSGRGAYPHELSALLLVPQRRAILSPSQLVGYLRLAPHARVLELGPGPGYFSIEVARALPAGRLELADLQAAMLVKARRRIQRAGRANVGYVQADATALPFRSATFDVALLIAVLGEVPDPAAGLRAVADVLKPGGRLACVELPGDPDALSVRHLQTLAASSPLRIVASDRLGRATATTFTRAGQ